MRVGQYRHEVRVAVPARDDVHVNVIEHACSRAPAEVEADVEAFALHGFGEELLATAGERHQFGQFLLGEIVEFAGVLVRRDHQVASSVGERVEQRETVSLADDDVVLRVVRLLRVTTKETARLFFPEDVLDPPRRPKMFHADVIELRRGQVNARSSTPYAGTGFSA